jgi:hypothetical protein
MVHQDLEIIKGTTVNYKIYFRANAYGLSEVNPVDTDYEVERLVVADGAVLDISSWSVYFYAKTNMSDVDGSAVIAKTVTSHDDPVNGISIVVLSVSDTGVSAGNYYYSLDFKDDDANNVVMFTGRLKIIEPVIQTRS